MQARLFSFKNIGRLLSESFVLHVSCSVGGMKASDALVGSPPNPSLCVSFSYAHDVSGSLNYVREVLLEVVVLEKNVWRYPGSGECTVRGASRFDGVGVVSKVRAC